MRLNKQLLDIYTTQMETAIDNDDIEEGHRDCDAVLCRLLMTLGYEDVVKIYKKQLKWYA